MANITGSLARQFRVLKQANRRQFMRYVGSGLLVLLFGIIIFVLGLAAAYKAYSTQSLVVVLGIILMLVGVIRILIGLIRPSVPNDLPLPMEEPRSLTDELFATERDSKE